MILRDFCFIVINICYFDKVKAVKQTLARLFSVCVCVDCIQVPSASNCVYIIEERSFRVSTPLVELRNTIGSQSSLSSLTAQTKSLAEH